MTTASPSRPFPLLSLLVCAGLSLGALAPRDAGAQAMIVMKDVCDDPSNTFDYQWARTKHGVTAAFLLRPDGSVVAIENADPSGLPAYPRLFVAAHGSASGTLSGMGYGAFVKALHDARPATPQLTYFAVCYSGKGPDSLLKQVNERYAGGIAQLQGGVTGCALTGNGVGTLAAAEYRIGTGKSDTQRYDRIVANIRAKWSANYPGEARSYKAVCDSLVAAAPYRPEPLARFMATVFHEFTQPALDPKDSTNYLDLIAINQGGQPLTKCGADPNGDGHKVACP